MKHSTPQSYYDEKYFAWQKNLGAFGGWANLTKFAPYIKRTDQVIDFGCGGGFLLAEIECAEKLGIEINPSARENALQLGIKTYADIADAPDDWADVIISNNALEHTANPFELVASLRPKLKVGGKIVFIIPCDSYKLAYIENDLHQHLFSWSPLNIGNLFTQAGFHVLESKPYLHKWPSRYVTIAKIFGKKYFDIICRIYGRFKKDWVQVRIIATRTQ